MLGRLWTLAGAQLQRADDAVDERLRRALVVHGLEQPGQLADAEMRFHPLVFAQHLLQLAPGGDGLAAGCLRIDEPTRPATDAPLKLEGGPVRE